MSSGSCWWLRVRVLDFGQARPADRLGFEEQTTQVVGLEADHEFAGHGTYPRRRVDGIRRVR